MGRKERKKSGMKLKEIEVRYGDQNQQMHTSLWKYIVNLVIPSICFGHSCRHPQGSTLRRINTLRRYKSYEPIHM
jgi:hypothetical protein